MGTLEESVAGLSTADLSDVEIRLLLDLRSAIASQLTQRLGASLVADLRHALAARRVPPGTVAIAVWPADHMGNLGDICIFEHATDCATYWLGDQQVEVHLDFGENEENDTELILFNSHCEALSELMAPLGEGDALEIDLVSGTVQRTSGAAPNLTGRMAAWATRGT